MSKRVAGFWEIAMLLVTCVLLLVAVASARDRAMRLGLRADSLTAVVDTLRLVYADSLRVWARRGVQVSHPGGTRVVVRPVLQVDTVRIVDTAIRYSRMPNDTVRHARFLRYQPPITLDAEVTLPPEPSPVALSATLTLDPIPVDVRVVCGRDRDGVRPVEASVTSPSYVTLSMATPEVSPEVCNRTAPSRSWWPTIALVTGFLGGLALSW